MSGYRERYRFTVRDPAAGTASLAPLLPVRLHLGAVEEAVIGLVDSGAAVSVLPWSVGARLGADWDAAAPVVLTGNLAAVEARVLVCEGVVGTFAPRRLAFAWSRSDEVPVLLGQVNFLLAFTFCCPGRAGGSRLVSRERGGREVTSRRAGAAPAVWGGCRRSARASPRARVRCRPRPS